MALKGRSVLKSMLFYGPLQRLCPEMGHTFHTWWNHPLRCWDVFYLSLMTKWRRGNRRTSDQPDSDPQNSSLIPQMYWTLTVCQALEQTLRLPCGQNAQKSVPLWLSCWGRPVIDKISNCCIIVTVREKVKQKRGIWNVGVEDSEILGDQGYFD